MRARAVDDAVSARLHDPSHDVTVEREGIACHFVAPVLDDKQEEVGRWHVCEVVKAGHARPGHVADNHSTRAQLVDVRCE